MKILRFWCGVMLGLHLRLFFSSNKQQSSTQTATTNNDNRIGVGDQGILAGDGAQVGNDNRTFDDHSSFAITSDSSNRSTNSTKNVDKRDFSDRSSFSSVDNRVTNITSLDPEVAKAAANAAARASEQSSAASKAASESNRDVALRALDTSASLAGSGERLLGAALNYGDSVSERAFEFGGKSLDASSDALKGALNESGNARADALTFGDRAIKALSGVFDTAVNLVAKGAKEDREFAGEFVGRVFDTTKSADQQNTEKIVKMATILGGIALGAWAAIAVFGKGKR